MNNVSNISTDSSNPLKKVSNFMTDRSATENKANDILSKEIQSSSQKFSQRESSTSIVK
jgi:hypothetical protein